jgi:hypothetical protein
MERSEMLRLKSVTEQMKKEKLKGENKEGLQWHL